MARFEEAEIRNLKMKICMKCNARNPIKATRCRKCNSKALRMKNKETKGK
ncbi:MAG: 50S ribosomal protein L40e [Candidatus Altiarchaeota archaeon]|nr:50S ribosomal protein L40e [Candidatus Altiarchaeota archaeon]